MIFTNSSLRVGRWEGKKGVGREISHDSFSHRNESRQIPGCCPPRRCPRPCTARVSESVAARVACCAELPRLRGLTRSCLRLTGGGKFDENIAGNNLLKLLFLT